MTTRLDDAPTPDALDQALQHAATHLLPVKAAPRGASVAERVQGTVKDMWHLRRVAQYYVADVLRPFTVVAQAGVALGSAYGFRSLSCLLPGSIRPLSFVNMVFCGAKAVVLSVICSVINCNRPGMRIDRAISPLSGRSSAPKTAKTRVQLRGPRGELLTQQEETDRFVAYCQKVYHAPPEPGPLLTDLALVGPGPLPESSTPLDPGAAPASGSRPPPFHLRRTWRPPLLFPALCR